MAKASDNEFPSLLLVGQAAAPAAPAAGNYRLFRDSAGGWFEVDDTGAVTAIAGGGGGTGQGFKDFDKKKRTSGNITLSAAVNTIADLDTTLDITLAAAAGDEIEVGIMGLSGAGGEGSMDVATVVAGSPVSYFGGLAAGTGNGPWHWSPNDSMFSGSLMKTLAAGDVSGGTVTLRLRYQNWDGTTKILYASTATPLQFWAKNLGPIPA
jgi:hypothetical protein